MSRPLKEILTAADAVDKAAKAAKALAAPNVAVLPRQRNEGNRGAHSAGENLNELIRRVAGASIEEIDRVILELQGVREMLRSEGERVSRELNGYASLNHASLTAMRVIGDSLKQWKAAPGL
jgi:hypothetical protein